jgi:prephenate dehydratase
MTAAPIEPIATVFVLGPEGTFSERAAEQVRSFLGTLGVENTTVKYRATLLDTLNQAAADASSVAVVPIENSETGTILVIQERLVQLPLAVEWELSLPVRFSVIANCPLPEALQVFAHPQAHAQCDNYTSSVLSHAQVVFTNSNTDSGARLRAHDAPRAAAIVPKEYAESYPDLLVATSVQNSPSNTTRFVVVRTRSTARPSDFRRSKTSIVVVPSEDRPGLLADMLFELSRFGLNVCRIESRPARTQPWKYIFFLDIDNNEHSEAAIAALSAVHEVTVLGTYDRLDNAANVP